AHISFTIKHQKKQISFQLSENRRNSLEIQAGCLRNLSGRNRPILPRKLANYEVAHHMMVSRHERQAPSHSSGKTFYALNKSIVRHRLNLSADTQQYMLVHCPSPPRYLPSYTWDDTPGASIAGRQPRHNAAEDGQRFLNSAPTTVCRNSAAGS